MKKRKFINRIPYNESMKIVTDFIEASTLELKSIKLKEENIKETDWSELIKFNKSYPRFEKKEIEKIYPSIKRSSIRSFKNNKISFLSLSKILSKISDYGINGFHKRTYPSAGAMYPTNLYLVSINIESLKSETSYFFNPKSQALEELFPFSMKEINNVINDDNIKGFSALLIFTSMYFKHSLKYGARGLRYSLIEIGAISQVINEAIIEEQLDCVWLGGFDDNLVKKQLDINDEIEIEQPFLLMPIG